MLCNVIHRIQQLLYVDHLLEEAQGCAHQQRHPQTKPSSTGGIEVVRIEEDIETLDRRKAPINLAVAVVQTRSEKMLSEVSLCDVLPVNDAYILRERQRRGTPMKHQQALVRVMG